MGVYFELKLIFISFSKIFKIKINNTFRDNTYYQNSEYIPSMNQL